MLSNVISLLMCVLPWKLKRAILNRFFNCDIAPSAYVGLSPVFSVRLILGEGARIGHFNVIRSLQRLHMGRDAKIGNFNYISAVPAGSVKHFVNEKDRNPELILEECSCLVGRHFLDCSNTIRIGAYTVVAGLHTAFFTHGIDIGDAVQRSAPIEIGKYCMIGTSCVILKGARLPDYCVLAANSTLQKRYEVPYRLYSGVPAVEVKELSQGCAFFSRKTEFIG